MAHVTQKALQATFSWKQVELDVRHTGYESSLTCIHIIEGQTTEIFNLHYMQEKLQSPLQYYAVISLIVPSLDKSQMNDTALKQNLAVHSVMQRHCSKPPMQHYLPPDWQHLPVAFQHTHLPEQTAHGCHCLHCQEPLAWEGCSGIHSPCGSAPHLYLFWAPSRQTLGDSSMHRQVCNNELSEMIMTSLHLSCGNVYYDDNWYNSSRFSLSKMFYGTEYKHSPRYIQLLM